MKRPPFRLTFLWRFTLLTFVVSLIAAFVLALAVENAHRRAIETDIEVSALGRVNAQLTHALDQLAKNGRLTPETLAAFARAREDTTLNQFVTDMRIYRVSGEAVYPVNAPSARDDVHSALASDNFLRVERGDKITAYEPYFTTNEQAYVVAVDFSAGNLGTQFERERRQVFLIVGVVTAIIFFSLVTLAAGASRELERRRRESQSTFVETLKLMAETIDLRDPYTAGHSQRVGEYSRKLAAAMHFPEHRIDVIESAALLHDIGKIAVPDAVLFKPSALDASERKIIGTHPVVGARLLQSIASMEDIVPCVLHHHEKIDGTGYPDKLLGEEIPMGARVIAVADSFDAMTTDRPYRRALTAEVAVAELRRVAGSQLDKTLVDAFAKLVERGAIVPPLPASNDVAFGRKAFAAAHPLG